MDVAFRHGQAVNPNASWVAAQIVEAVSEQAVEAAIQAADQSAKADDEIRQALRRELEEARYEASARTKTGRTSCPLLNNLHNESDLLIYSFQHAS